MNNYGLILKQLRALSGDSLKTAAHKIGKSVGWLSEVENGRGLSRLRPEEFERIVILFNGDKHRELFKTWVAVEKTKYKTDRSLDGAVLKYIREKRELSLVEAAQKIGISVRHICFLENGRRLIDPDLKDRAMKAYGYTPSSFRNFSRDPKRSQAVPVRYKIIALINQLKQRDLEEIYELAAKLLATEKPQLGFLDASNMKEGGR